MSLVSYIQQYFDTSITVLTNQVWKLLIALFKVPNTGALTVLFWQKEASDKSSKSEILMLLDWTSHVLLLGRVWSRYTHPAYRYLRQDIMILHWCQCKWQTHFPHLQKHHFIDLLPFVKVGQYSHPVLLTNNDVGVFVEKLEELFEAPQAADETLEDKLGNGVLAILHPSQ